MNRTALNIGASVTAVVAVAGALLLGGGSEHAPGFQTAAAEQPVHVHEDGGLHYHDHPEGEGTYETPVEEDGGEVAQDFPVTAETYPMQGHGMARYDREATAPEGRAAALAEANGTVAVRWMLAPDQSRADEEEDTVFVGNVPVGGYLVFSPATGEAYGKDFARYDHVTFESNSREWVMAHSTIWARPLTVETDPLTRPHWMFAGYDSALMLDSEADRDANALANLLLNGGTAGTSTVTVEAGDRPASGQIVGDFGTITYELLWDTPLEMPSDRPVMSRPQAEVEAYIEQFEAVHGEG